MYTLTELLVPINNVSKFLCFNVIFRRYKECKGNANNTTPKLLLILKEKGKTFNMNQIPIFIQ